MWQNSFDGFQRAQKFHVYLDAPSLYARVGEALVLGAGESTFPVEFISKSHPMLILRSLKYKQSHRSLNHNNRVFCHRSPN